ncbi:site-specific integrase [Vibrio breoganii]
MRYLSVNACGNWTFRFQIPAAMRPMFNFKYEIKRSLGRVTEQAATIKALQLELDIRKRMGISILPNGKCTRFDEPFVHGLTLGLVQHSIEDISRALKDLQSDPEKCTALRHKKAQLDIESRASHNLFHFNLRSSPLLRSIHNVYNTSNSPIVCAENIFGIVKFLGDQEMDVPIERFKNKLINIYNLRLEARNALELLDFKKVEHTLVQLQQVVETEEPVYDVTHQALTLNHASAERCANNEATGAKQHSESSDPVALDNEPKSPSENQSDTAEHLKPDNKYLVENVCEAYLAHKAKLREINNEADEEPPALRKSVQKFKVVCEVAKIVDIRSLDKSVMLEQAVLLKGMPCDPLKTKNASMFVNEPKSRWPIINEKIGLDTWSVRNLNAHLSSVSAITKWATEQGDYPEVKHCGNGLVNKKSKGKKDSQDKLPLNNSELNSVFGDKIYSSGEIGVNTRTKQVMTYQYWLPIITYLCGLRGNEVAQLYRCDIGEKDGIYFFDVRAGQDKQSVKNNNAIRRVPMHSKLIELGFIEYIERFKPTERLFPELSYHTNDKYYKNCGDWFNRAFKSLFKDDRDKKSFYSLRHNFVGDYEDHARNPVLNALFGHANYAISADRYGESVALEKLQKLVESRPIHSVFANIVPFSKTNYFKFQGNPKRNKR